MADSVAAFFNSLFPSYKPKTQDTPSRYQGETRTVGSSAPAPPAPSATARDAARPTAAPVQKTGEPPSGSNSEEIRRQREKFLNEKFGAGKGKTSKTLRDVPTQQDTTPASVLAWD
jgi:hypothetical protein